MPNLREEMKAVRIGRVPATDLRACYDHLLFLPDLETMKPGSAMEAKIDKSADLVLKGTAPSGKHRISWSVVNLTLDLLLFVTFVTLCWLAALTHFVFPSGATGASWRLFGGTVETWRSLQFGVLCVFAGEVLVHIMLHWSWVSGVVESRFRSRRG